MKEIFKIIPEFPDYEISNIGKIRNVKTKEFVRQFLITNGALQVRLTGGKFKLVSRLVAECFMNTNLQADNVVYHIDRNKQNNSISNLQIWGNISLLKDYLLSSEITINPAYLKK